MARRKGTPENKTPEEGKVVAKYELDARERALREKQKARFRNTPPAPRVKLENRKVGYDHPDRVEGFLLCMESLGTTSQDFSAMIQDQLINALSTGKDANIGSVNAALAVISSIQPRDEIETMLVAQMAAIHSATMTQAWRLNRADMLQQFDSHERALNRLARTFTTQMEALKRYRTGGEQKMTIHHVTVNEGGQAIVGTVEQGKDRGEG